MTPDLRWPATALAAGLGALLIAQILDQGSPTNRDAALVVGSLALYALIPAAAIWLVVAVTLRLRSRHGSRRR